MAENFNRLHRLCASKAECVLLAGGDAPPGNAHPGAWFRDELTIRTFRRE